MLGVHPEKIGGEQVVGFIRQVATYALGTACISHDGGGRLQVRWERLKLSTACRKGTEC